MRKGQSGQAFILVLILLAIGALTIVPALRLTDTELQSSRLIEQKTKALYAASAAQEWVLWALTNPDYVATMEMGVTREEQIDVCGITVDISIIMLAVEGTGAVELATEDKIKPTKTVDTGFVPDYWVPDRRLNDYLYTIKLDHLSSDTSEGLDAIYDLPPGGISAYIGPTEMRVDGGEWMTVPDPDSSQLVSKGYLKWPAEYDKDTHTGAFSSNPAFYGMENFAAREVKELRFWVRGTLANNDTHSNWVVLKMENGTNTLSGPQAPIKVGGDPDIPPVSEGHSVLEVTKESFPSVILPGVIQEVTYIISITNMYTQTRNIETIIDYLPPGFAYDEFLGSELDGEPIEILDPDVPTDPEDVNGVPRYPVQWSTTQFGGSDLSIGSGKTLELTFKARTTQEVSGSYYNEVVVLLRETGLPPGFADVGVTQVDYVANYSWTTGAVMVPAFDSEANADGTIIDTNLSLVAGGVSFSSWKIR